MNQHTSISTFESVITNYEYNPIIAEEGVVLSVGDGIARVSGLIHAMSQELLKFPGDVYGIVETLDPDYLACILLGPSQGIKAGDPAIKTGKVLEVPVGTQFLGRVVNALGQPVDDLGPIVSTKFRNIEFNAPPLVEREPVKDPLETGIKIIDLLLPLGRGQRELIIGDRKTGKTAIAIDMIINQKNKSMRCVYTVIGQKMACVAELVDTLKKFDMLKNTIIVVASAEDPAGMQYLAPYSATAMAEEFLYQGEDALVIFDDLSKHAIAYRELSLLLRRPPGREAYPGDIFYLHSRLLERAAKLGKKLGGGSLSMIPIAETKAGNIASYIPTNLISITDGQIYLDNDLFNAGFKPAINIGISVSRVGGKAQTSAMRQISAHLKLDLAQFEELQIFSQFGEDLDKNTLAKIKRGRHLKEILKQNQGNPMPAEHQIVVMSAINAGILDNEPIETIAKLEAELIQFMTEKYRHILNELKEKKHIDDALMTAIQNAIQAFSQTIQNV